LPCLGPIFPKASPFSTNHKSCFGNGEPLGEIRAAFCMKRLINGVSPSKYVSVPRRSQPIFYAFDLLYLNGEDLRSLPLIERKQYLHALIKKSHLAEIIYAQHIETQGEAFFEEICHRDLEGVVAKCKRGAYRDDGNGVGGTI
jgi:ATP dependent DNA ligase domain